MWGAVEVSSVVAAALMLRNQGDVGCGGGVHSGVRKASKHPCYGVIDGAFCGRSWGGFGAVGTFLLSRKSSDLKVILPVAMVAGKPL